MLDKLSKKVLNYAIDLYTKNGISVNIKLNGSISFFDEDIESLGIDCHRLSVICLELETRGYFQYVKISDDCNDISVRLSQKGFAYNELERRKLLTHWLPIVINFALSAATIVINVLLLLLN